MLLEQTLAQIKEKFPDPVLETTEFAGEQILHVKGQEILTVLTALKANDFNFLADLTAIDNLTLGGYERFAVSYHLLCHKTAERLTVKAYVPEEKPSLPSVESLWKTANWQEREVFDLFGILFEGHPNLTRIMNPDDYDGHPLRKDYPRLGRKERGDFPVIDRGIQKQKPSQ
ncbi:MAG: NADH-quinone oxidoreductase subunit C [Candidatus Marinimicrobia bacterium]|jgi:NADH-quinone oxidoreductase subunit C|nr:NADH-quinone oxidoreductase subunit C [Candidatus Neomarinimicrobiota bacterium]MDP7126567.1 NADH-quinone oxidoreductase subunit C [Candidatus Neomarinimicrobiota bacterium]HJN67856.1 NADH-quinone oxidoreductase subunit C [Candidatus Neomarinimicrobiota bacterium]